MIESLYRLADQAMRAIAGTLIFTILVPGSVTVGVPYLLLASGVQLSYDIGNFRFIGIVLIAISVVFYFWTVLDFVIIGKGTPAPIDPPVMLVSRRLYRVVRNPMYTGVILTLLSESIFFMSGTILAYALLVWLLFHLFTVYYEEPHLRKKFGALYDEYCKVMPRWIPRFRCPGENR